MELDAFCVQCVSREDIPDGLSGYRTFNEYKGLRIGARLELRKEGRKSRPVVAPPWPVSPSIGAHECLDPFENQRWPSYLLTSGRIHLPDPADHTVDNLVKLLHLLREFVWCSFTSLPELKTLGDQRVSAPGCRRTYISDIADINGNPFQQPAENYVVTATWQPVGPGFSALPHMFFPPTDREKPHSLYMVWSQAVSLPPGTRVPDDIDVIRKRVREFRLRSNGHDEMLRARRHLEQSDVKGCVRSAASGVEATVRHYCGEWGVGFPDRGNLPFHKKIDDVLLRARRAAYEYARPSEACLLTNLYRARNSQHEGDCMYADIRSSAPVEVTLSVAKELLRVAERFILWLDSQA